MNKKTALRLSIATVLLLLLLPSILLEPSRVRGMGPPPSQCPNLYPATDFTAAQVYLPNGTSVDLIARPNATFTTTLVGGYTLFLRLEVPSNYTQPPGSVYMMNTVYNFDSYSCFPALAGEAFTYTIHVQGSLFRPAGVQINVVWAALSNYTGNPANEGYTQPVRYNVHWVSSTPDTTITTTVTTILPAETVTLTSTQATTVTSTATMTTAQTASTPTLTSTAGQQTTTFASAPRPSTTVTTTPSVTTSSIVTSLVSAGSGLPVSSSSSSRVSEGSSKSGSISPTFSGSSLIVLSIATAAVIVAVLAFTIAQRGRRHVLS